MKAYQAFAQLLTGHGIRDIFGVMGDGNMSWYAALARNPAVRIFDARHEGASLAMAPFCSLYQRLVEAGTVGRQSIASGLRSGVAVSKSMIGEAGGGGRTPVTVTARTLPALTSFELTNVSSA